MTKTEHAEYELDEIISGLTVIRDNAKKGNLMNREVVLYYLQHLYSILGHFPEE